MILDLDTIDLNIFLLQHKAIGVGNNFQKLRSPSPCYNIQINFSTR